LLVSGVGDIIELWLVVDFEVGDLQAQINIHAEFAQGEKSNNEIDKAFDPSFREYC